MACPLTGKDSKKLKENRENWCPYRTVIMRDRPLLKIGEFACRQLGMGNLRFLSMSAVVEIRFEFEARHRGSGQPYTFL
jgi:hypothetical protein